MQAQPGLLWRRWDDEFVVYNPASGDSHYLDFVSGEGLMRLELGSMTALELADDLARSLDITPDEALSVYVETMLNSFLELGLARTAAS